MLNDRLEGLGAGPFQRLATLLADVRPAVNRPSFDLAIGEPRHAYPEFVGALINDNRHLYGRYPSALGTPEYRSACADWLTNRFRLPTGMIAADRHIVPLNGTREGLFLLALAVVPSRKAAGTPLVLLPNPFYHPYAGAAFAAGGEPRYLPAVERNGFLPDFGTLNEADLARTVLVYLCSPANPQGSAADVNYLTRLVELARAHDFVLAIDECYSEIYTERAPSGALEACARLGGSLKNVLVFHSLSKRSSVPGLRCGFVAGDPDLLKSFVALRHYACAQIPLPIFAAGTALWRDEAHVETNRALYRAKFDAAERILSNRFGYRRPAGSFFLWLDVVDGEKAALRLWRDGGVRVIPGGYLSRPVDGENPGQRYIRVALVDDLEKTEAALGALQRTL
ncbi:MAG: aminotransferase class I/II-fold pyridoxal phosphate-dependent enzyme [Alphaproteobacteria bacterium]|nr:aminotransferase class I/II-fold pyridoxal phosphate-dependent enzyme [Alphaproteobacteria bacterium]